MSTPLERRHDATLRFLTTHVPSSARILDLGADNPFAARMRAAGYTVFNTDGDLDLVPSAAARDDVDVVTAFEILEHLVAPFNVLSSIRTGRLVASIPMRLWFASAYRNPRDRWDQHFHEFEVWQFDWLLEKTGWRIDASEKWTSVAGGIGFRPFLRRIVPRYYAVVATRTSPPRVVTVD